MSRNIAIGIDLGTTNSCVAVVRNGNVDIIANDQGNRVTPSFVAFSEGEKLTGDAAKEQAAWNPKNTIFDAKRLIGRKYDDPALQKKINNWPYKVINLNGNPKFEIVTDFREVKHVTPEEISAYVLVKMKETAEDFLGQPVKDAVITVPAYFNDSQRQATLDAGKIAGLNVMSIINEPTAAAIAYGVDKKIKQKRNVLIYDLGGGTFDVVVMAIENEKFDVLAVSGDTFLGGGDFDDRLVEHFVQIIKTKHLVDISHNPRLIGKLRKSCEKAKRNLSSSLKEKIIVENIKPDVTFESNLSRVKFENLCGDLFNNTLTPVATVLRDAKLGKNEIDEIVLAGGSTRIPKIQELLMEYFSGKKLNKTINPDEAVAYGAAMHAAMLSGENTVEEILLLDVTPLSLGINVEGDYTERIIEKNTKVPTENKKRFTTVYDYQKAVDIKVYEGERKMSKDNNLLGEFLLENIQVALRGVAKIDVTFKIDSNGILTASAKDSVTGSNDSIVITSNKGRLKAEEIERMVIEVSDYKSKDNQKRQSELARSAFEKYCFDMQSAVKDHHNQGLISSLNMKKVIDACDEALEWLEVHQTGDKNDYEDKKMKLKRFCDCCFACE